MLGLLGPVNVVFVIKNESQEMGWSNTNRNIESLQLGAGIIGLGCENFTADGVIIVIMT
jgi:bifunctional ADP-heptose synthase (sugar kinase/adenylyltransferase)